MANLTYKISSNYPFPKNTGLQYVHFWVLFFFYPVLDSDIHAEYECAIYSTLFTLDSLEDEMEQGVFCTWLFMLIY